MGPGGGDAGGKIVCAGTPTAVAAFPKSVTGQLPVVPPTHSCMQKSRCEGDSSQRLAVRKGWVALGLLCAVPIGQAGIEAGDDGILIDMAADDAQARLAVAHLVVPIVTKLGDCRQ